MTLVPHPSQTNCEALVSRGSKMLSARLSIERSAEIIACIERWMHCASVRSTYELALIVDIPRGTLQRWLTRRVTLPVSSVKRIADGLAEHAKRTMEAQQALADLVQLCPMDDLGERLRAEFRTRGARLRSAMAAIEAAGLRLVPIDEMPGNGQQTPPNASTQTKEATCEDSPAA
jgi:hypothetical protein